MSAKIVIVGVQVRGFVPGQRSLIATVWAWSGQSRQTSIANELLPERQIIVT